jgi:hypothetical protein
MKKIFNIVIAPAMVAFLFISCEKDLIVGNGPVVTETRSVSNFRGVSYRVPGKVYFKVGAFYKVEVSAQRNILDVLRTDIVNGILIIDFRNNVRVREHEDIIVNITAPSADYLDLSGVGDMNVEGDLITNNLDLSVSGLGNIFIQKATVNGEINGEISGSGNISIAAGSAVNEELRISGSGDMNLSNVVAEKAKTNTKWIGGYKSKSFTKFGGIHFWEWICLLPGSANNLNTYFRVR